MAGGIGTGSCKDRAAAAGLHTLVSYRGLKPLLLSHDFMLSEKFIHSRFHVKTKRLVIPDHAERSALQAVQPEPDTQAAALITGEGLAAYAYAATGARTLKSAVTAGTVVHMVGGILGLLMMLALAIVGAEDLLTPANVMAYELIWMIPGLLITEWTRSV